MLPRLASAPPWRDSPGKKATPRLLPSVDGEPLIDWRSGLFLELLGAHQLPGAFDLAGAYRFVAFSPLRLVADAHFPARGAAPLEAALKREIAAVAVGRIVPAERMLLRSLLERPGPRVAEKPHVFRGKKRGGRVLEQRLHELRVRARRRDDESDSG